jgi:hypothetical protein
MATVPPDDERVPEGQRPPIGDAVTPEEQARLARVLVGVLISVAEERAKREGER